MRRRTFGVVVVSSPLALAGCLNDGPLVEEELTEGKIYSLELEADATVSIELANNSGDAAFVTLRNPDGESVLSEGTETSDTYAYQVSESGTHELQVTPSETASIRATVE